MRGYYTVGSLQISARCDVTSKWRPTFFLCKFEQTRRDTVARSTKSPGNLVKRGMLVTVTLATLGTSIWGNTFTSFVSLISSAGDASKLAKSGFFRTAPTGIKEKQVLRFLFRGCSEGPSGSRNEVEELRWRRRWVITEENAVFLGPIAAG